jgi:peptide/nickel transport system substrate-binding protein
MQDALAIQLLTRDPQIWLLRGRDTQRVGVILNLRYSPFKDVRVRRALLGHGIDRQAIAKTALLGQAPPLWSFVPPGSRGHIDFGEQFPYDPEKARALLKEAGLDQQNPLRYAITTHGAEGRTPYQRDRYENAVREAWGGGDSRRHRSADFPATLDRDRD